MRRWLGGLGAILLIATLAAIGYVASLPRDAPPSAETVEPTPARLARGDYLFNAVLGCPVCHSERDFESFGAPPMPPFGGGRTCAEPGKPLPGLAEAGGLPGTICFRNITPHATGIGDWTDGEVLRAVREGVGRRGDALFPIMPYFIYRHLSDSDARAVVAYLRTLGAVDNALPDTTIDFPVSLFIRLLPAPLEAAVDHPDESDRVAYGRYLATVARCAFCHSPRDPRSRQPVEGREFAGGAAFQGRRGMMFSTNLTTHPSGIGDMSETDFVALFRRAADADATDVSLMPWTYFGRMTDADLGAIHAYLQTLSPVAYAP